ncbi:MAG: PAS domain S-box protein, partial [Promethearchaeati archaeon]
MGIKRTGKSEERQDTPAQAFDKWQSLIHQISGVLYECAFDQHWTMYWITEGIEELTGYPPSDIINNNVRSYNSIIHPNDRAIVREIVGKAVRQNEYFSTEYRIIDSTGTIKWVEERGMAEYDDQGNPDYLRGIIIDATRAKEAKRIARESQQKYRALFESSMDGIAFSDLDGHFQEVNPAFAEMTGYTEQELKKLTHQDITPSKYQEMEREVYHPQLVKRGYSDFYEKEYIRKNGSTFPARIRKWLFTNLEGNPFHVAAIVQDISEEKSAAKALERSQEQFRLLFNESPIGIEILDENGRIIRTNPSALEIFGVKEEQQVIGFSLLTDPNTPDFAKENIRNHESCIYESQFDYSLIRKHNLYETNRTRVVHLETKITPLGAGDDSTFRGFMLQIEDVSEQKKALESLRQSEERFYALFRDSPIGIEILDKKGQIIRANSAAQEIFGVSTEEEIIGFNILEDPNTPEQVKNKIRNREAYRFDSKFDYSRVKEQGLYTTSKSGIAYLETLITPLGKGNDSDFRGFMIQLQDVTERKNMLKALQDSEEQYRTTLEALDDPMYVVDKDLRINLTNPALTKWVNKLGLDGNIVGKHITDAFPFISEKVLEEYHRVFTDGIVFRTRDEVHLHRTTVHAETTKVPIMSGGRTVQVLTKIRDITSQYRNRMELERSEKRYRTLIKSIDLGFLFHDSAGRIRSVNPSAENILGVSEKDAKNHRFEQLSIELRNENGTE